MAERPGGCNRLVDQLHKVIDGRGQRSWVGILKQGGVYLCADELLLQAVMQDLSQCIAMDMWQPYIQATHQHVPLAGEKIVFDRFHVMKLATTLNDHLEGILTYCRTK